MSTVDKYTREGDKRFTLRIDKDLFKSLEDLAVKDKRSIGKQIEFIIERYLQDVPVEQK